MHAIIYPHPQIHLCMYSVHVPFSLQQQECTKQSVCLVYSHVYIAVVSDIIVDVKKDITIIVFVYSLALSWLGIVIALFTFCLTVCKCL